MNNSKNSVRTLTMLALLVAMSIVFSRVLSISTGFVRFNLGSLPVLLAALLFGPGAGFVVGVVADTITSSNTPSRNWNVSSLGQKTSSNTPHVPVTSYVVSGLQDSSG